MLKRGLYFITDINCTLSEIDQVRLAVDCGIEVIQYRNKNDPDLGSLKLIRTITKNKILIINDDPNLAKEIDADGVHLGQKDMNIGHARKILGKKIIGVSASSLHQALNAEKEGANYIGVGPIFDTSTKTDHDGIVGVDTLKLIKEHVKIPIVAIGGINESNIDKVLEAKPQMVAIISDILYKKDIKNKICFYDGLIKNGRI